MTKDIVLITDDNYVLPTLVCINSITNNLRECDGLLKVHICTFGLTNENIELLKTCSNDYVQVVIDIIKIGNYENMMKNISEKSHVSKSALIKFELPNIYRDKDTLLYLDSDIVIKGDICELLDMDVSAYYLAAAFDYWVRYNNLRYRFGSTAKEAFYFNSGVMLLNLKKMREDALPKKLWDYKLNKAKTSLMDQECLNEVCGGCVKPLSIRWNFNPVFCADCNISEINKVYGESFSSCDDMISEVAIIHYVGKSDKPWIYKDARLKDYWINEFKDIVWPERLDLKENVTNDVSFYSKVENITRSFGMKGVISYIIFLIKQKVRSTK